MTLVTQNIIRMKVLFFLLLSLGSLGLFGQSSTVLLGNFSQLSNDTIKCMIQLNYGFPRKTQAIKIAVQNGKFRQPLNIHQPTYLYVTDGENYINGLIDPGDSVFINFDTSKSNPLKFEGKGKEKFQFINLLSQAKVSRKLIAKIDIIKSKKHPFDYMFNFVDSTENWYLNRLDSLKPYMTPKSYSLLYGDTKGSFLGDRNRSVGLVYHENIEETLRKRKNELTQYSKSTLQNILHFDSTLSSSATYVFQVFNILFHEYDYRLATGTASNNLLMKYRYFDSLLPVSLKAPVLTLLLEKDIKQLNQAEEIESLIQKIYQLPQDSSYKNHISRVYNDALSISVFKMGEPAPKFTVENTNGEKVSLNNFKGKVVYLDFWYAACGPCHLLFKDTKPVKKYFESNDDVVFLNISIDKKEVWKKSIKQYNILGYNAYTEDRTNDHPIIKAYKVSGYPTTCIIDRDGNIFNANPSNIAEELKIEIENALKIK